MKGNVIITGGNSQLAQCMKSVLSTRGMSFLFDYNYAFTTREELDITEEESIEKFISKYDEVKYIVNCAAYTKVDQAQLESEACKKINTDGVKNLGMYCKEHDIFLITFGTEQVFNQRQLDSAFVADTLDPNLENWLNATFVDYETNEKIVKYLYIKENTDIRYTITPQDTLFLYNKIEVKTE